VILAVSSATPAQNKESLLLKPFDVMLLSDKNHENARRFASYDDFEDMELHSTTLIDAQGRVRWKRSGGDPFGDVDFLLNEIKRWRQ
jgi:peroxiredoxin